MGGIRFAIRLPLFLLITVAAVLPALVFWILGFERTRGYYVRFYYLTACRLLGIRMIRHNRLSPERPLMLVANHASYLDILVLGSLVPLSFTPKKEIRSWPVIGFLCVLADCVFVERRPTDMKRAREAMEQKLEAGKVLCLFPEGTTSDGKQVVPFKSGFFSLAEDHPLPVQPVSIAYTHIGGEPISDARRNEIAWIGEATFFGHFLHFMTLPGVQVEVLFHPIHTATEMADRKALTKACENAIATGLKQLLEANHAG